MQGGYTGMRGLISDRGVMKALQTNLQLVAKAYDKALGCELPSELKEKLQLLYKTVKEHLDYADSQA